MKTNIIELSKLYKKPCKEWLRRFVDGKIDAHKAFIEFGEQYEWLYMYSDYDLVGWEIENDVFDWEKNSWILTKYCTEKFDSEKFNWEKYSYYVARFCPDKLDSEKFNWKEDSQSVLTYCPYKFDPEKFIWKKYDYNTI